MSLAGRWAPISHRTLPIAQGERFDVVVEFSRYPVGTTVKLANRIGEGTATHVMQFRVVCKEEEACAVPERFSDMSDFDVLDGSDAVLTRDFNFTRAGEEGKVVWSINGEVFDPLRVDTRPELGSTEIWEFTTDVHHPVHLHLVHFKVLSRNREPLPKDASWKDTMDVPGQIVRLLIRFDGYRSMCAFHCHNMEHEDIMILTNFEVV